METAGVSAETRIFPMERPRATPPGLSAATMPAHMKTQRGFGIFHIIVLLLVLAGGWIGFKQYEKWQTSQRTERARADREQDGKRIESIAARWADAVKLAGATSRIALAQPVGSMQAVKRELEGVALASDCMRAGRDRQAEAMGLTISAFLSFMQQNEIGAAGYFDQSRQKAEEAEKTYTDCRAT
jgi:hypothetical protein